MAAKIMEVGRGREAAPKWAVAVLLPRVGGVQNSGSGEESVLRKPPDQGARAPTQNGYSLFCIEMLSKGQ